MNKYLLFCLCILSSSLNAQTFSYSTTKECKIKGDDVVSFIRIGNQNIKYEIDYGSMQFAYTAKLSKVKYGINIARYDDNMQELQKLSLDNGEKKFGPFEPVTIAFADKLNIFYYQYFDNETIKLFATQINPENLSVIKTIELFTFDQRNVGIFKIENAINSNKIYTTVSPDHNKVLVTHSNTSDIHCMVIDENLNITSTSVITTPQLKDFTVASILLDNDGNKYFSYDYVENKEMRRGILIDNNKDKPVPQTVKLDQGELAPNSLYFANSKDGNTVYVYANYYENYLNEGLLLSTMDKHTFKINKPSLFPYPDDLKQRLYKLDFAEKAKGKLSVRKTYYAFNELDNGTVTLTGSPYYSISYTNSKGYTKTEEYSGPIITIFLAKDRNAMFTMIPRDLNGWAAGLPRGLTTTINNNKLICFYADKEKNLSVNLNEKPSSVKHSTDMVLAAAIFDENGNVVSRQKIADPPGGKNTFIMNAAQLLNKRTLFLPLGQDRVNFVRVYFQLSQLALVEIN